MSGKRLFPTHMVLKRFGICDYDDMHSSGYVHWVVNEWVSGNNDMEYDKVTVNGATLEKESALATLFIMGITSGMGEHNA